MPSAGEQPCERFGDILACDKADTPVAAVRQSGGGQRAAEHGRHDVQIQVVAKEGVRDA